MVSMIRGIILLLYIICIYLFGIFIRYLEYSDFFLCYNCEEVDNPEIKFDYIVVGCGSAGAIVARRLAEDKKNRVLILEVGRHGNSILDIPPFGLLLQKTRFDWQYTTVPQKSSCLAIQNNSSVWPMGKMVGGTSMLNNMIYVRGHQQDFNDWFKDLVGYSFKENVLPYFKKVEKWNTGDKYGSVYLSNLTFSTKLPKYILEAAKELNYHTLENGVNCEDGFSIPQMTSFNGQRWTPAHKLLEKRTSNIFLRTNRQVEKILFHDNFEAYGVKYSYLGNSYIATASKGVILSAGVLGTPKILLHSGIGPKTHLDNIGIKTKINLPVGENLQDHVTTGFDLVLLKEPLGLGIEQILSPFSALNYFWTGTGPWTTGGCEVLAHLKTQPIQNRNAVPDLQFMVMTLGLNEDNGKYFRKLVGITDEVWDNYFAKLNDTPTITLLPVLLHPKSRGTVRLKDKKFISDVLIDPNYLTNKHDVEVLIRGIQIVRRLVETKAMKSLGATFNTNVLPNCKKFAFGTKAYWKCYIHHLTVTAYHPVGTCKMGHNDNNSSVIDFNFQVKRSNNLFVVDASVFPTLTSGNINAAIFMMAEMAADVLKFREFITAGKCTIKEIFVKKDFCKM